MTTENIIAALNLQVVPSTLPFLWSTQLFANDFFSRCVRCFNCLPQVVVAAETVAEFKRKLSNVDLSSFLRYNFNT